MRSTTLKPLGRVISARHTTLAGVLRLAIRASRALRSRHTGKADVALPVRTG